jgi:hypothetical protein
VAQVTVTFRNFANAPKMIRKTNVECRERCVGNELVDVCCALLPLDVTSCLTTAAVGDDTVHSWVASGANPKTARSCSYRTCSNVLYRVKIGTGFVPLPFSLTSGISQYED